MALRIYNSLTRSKDPFEPLEPGKVRMYVCGVTVYDLSHVGHARAAVVFDVIYRFMRSLGYEVDYVRNFTDIDDKIIRRAGEEGIATEALAEKYIEAFRDDFEPLGLLSPRLEPRATEHLAQIVALIERLIAGGHAYVGGRDVFFSVKRFPGYGKLSHRETDDLLAGARVEIDEKKEYAGDFALWKGAKEGEPAWDSPWGPGRPGWHIECSAMATAHLGETIDIHGGGLDLKFPHHENEIAQSEAASGKPFARWWLHNGFVTIDKEKMSKSLGNFFTVREILSKFTPEVLRYFLISSHYRGPLDFSFDRLTEARQALERVYGALAKINALSLPGHAAPPNLPGPGDPPPHGASGVAADAWNSLASLSDRVREAMEDDFNTAQAVGQVFETVRAINIFLAEVDRGQAGPTPFTDLLARLARLTFEGIGEILGVLRMDPDTFLRGDAAPVDSQRIERLIAERAAARKGKDFARADEIRDGLADEGVLLEDGPNETTWKFGKERPGDGA
ncbi:MAG: cysteine--tRNA ligase [Deltaproteobacteria bacterium]|nr:cysteine--tRNA ligase [Deltaproteobacteria bacterium]